MSQPLSPVERIEIERACERVILDYSRALDLGDMSAAADCFAANGSMARPMNPDVVIQGREAIRASLLTRPTALHTKHLETNILIDVQGRDAATGLSYLTMISVMLGEDAKPPHVSPGPLWFGECVDSFVRENGVWKLLDRRGSIQMKYAGGPPA